jgi:hypothetical protein
MKTIHSVLILLVLTTAATAQQSVADAARQARSQKHPGTATVHIDGDSMPRLATASSAEPAKAKDTQQPADTKGADAKPADANATDGKDQAKGKAAEPPKPKAEDWTSKIEEQKKEIATLQRELDILQREQRLRAAAFYGDAGTQLRDQAKFAEDSRKEQAEIDAKKQALAEAQQKLEDLQEAARKAGASTR